MSNITPREYERSIISMSNQAESEKLPTNEYHKQADKGIYLKLNKISEIMLFYIGS
jgi:hypothetical protein